MTLASAIPETFKGVYNPKIGHMTLTTPLSGTICHRRLGHAMVKFEVSSFTDYGNKKNIKMAQNGVIWVTQGHSNVTI